MEGKKRVIFVIVSLIAVLTVYELVYQYNREPQEDSLSETEKSGEFEEGRTESLKALLKSCEDFAGEPDSTAEEILERETGMIKQLGKAGCSVVDQKNEINMENYKQVRKFCEAAEKGEIASVEIYAVTEECGLICYQLSAAEGTLRVQIQSASWNEEGGIDIIESEETEADAWVYTEKGYLFFQEYEVPGYDGPHEDTAIRVEPLKEEYRELNREYIEPLGYYMNNAFLTDWDETDGGTINYYDLFEALYRQSEKTAVAVDYPPENTYEVPAEQFERVIAGCFPFSKEIIRSKTVYHSETNSYQYRPRGLYDHGDYAEIPYPEVVDCEKTADGTIKLTVNAVWPTEQTDMAVSHEVVIQTLEDGEYRYLSNRVLSEEPQEGYRWYPERLTEEEWKSYDLPMEAGEKETAETDCLEKMELVRPVLEQRAFADALPGIRLTEEEILEMQEIIGKSENSVFYLESSSDLCHYEKVQTFLEQCQMKQDGEVTVYEVCENGGINRKDFFMSPERCI